MSVKTQTQQEFSANPKIKSEVSGCVNRENQIHRAQQRLGEEYCFHPFTNIFFDPFPIVLNCQPSLTSPYSRPLPAICPWRRNSTSGNQQLGMQHALSGWMAAVRM